MPETTTPTVEEAPVKREPTDAEKRRESRRTCIDDVREDEKPPLAEKRKSRRMDIDGVRKMHPHLVSGEKPAVPSRRCPKGSDPAHTTISIADVVGMGKARILPRVDDEDAPPPPKKTKKPAGKK